MSLLNNRRTRLWVALAASAAAVLLGFVMPSARTMAVWHRDTGYYILLAGFLLWLCSQPPERVIPSRMHGLLKEHALPLALSVVLVLGIFLVSPPRYRVLADEANLLGTALSMYEQRLITDTPEALFYFESFDAITSAPDKRPPFFPFLVSLAHALTGYRAANGFIVNAVAGTAALFCFYVILGRWFSRGLALTGMLFLASFPVFALWVTSSGFEIVNLLFVILAFLFLDRYLQTGRGRHAERLLFTLVLLAQCRYESALFVILAVPVVWRLWQSRDADGGLGDLRLRLCLVPLLLLPVAWQRMSKLQPVDFQITEGPSFGLDYLARNAAGAWRYLTQPDLSGGMLPVVFALTVVGVVWAIVDIGRKGIAGRARHLVIAAAASHVLLAGVVLSHAWGDISRPYVNRLVIAFLPALIAPAVYAVHRLARVLSGAAHEAAFAVAVALILLHWPIAGRGEPVRQLQLYRDYRSVLSVVHDRLPNQSPLIISDTPGLFVPHRWSSLGIPSAVSQRESLQRNFRQRLFPEVLAVQHIAYATGRPIPGNELPGYQLEPIYEAQSSAHTLLRISRAVFPE